MTIKNISTYIIIFGWNDILDNYIVCNCVFHFIVNACLIANHPFNTTICVQMMKQLVGMISLTNTSFYIVYYTTSGPSSVCVIISSTSSLRLCKLLLIVVSASNTELRVADNLLTIALNFNILSSSNSL